MSSELEQQRALTENIFDRIADYRNIDQAYIQVKSNDVRSGIDMMEVEELYQWLGGHLKELQETILQEQYEVRAVRKVEIPNPTVRSKDVRYSHQYKLECCNVLRWMVEYVTKESSSRSDESGMVRPAVATFFKSNNDRTS